MDAALRNRFEEFEIEYDAVSFLDFMDKQDWHEDIQTFIGAGMWMYKKPGEIKEGGRYISPRTWEKIESALRVDNFKKNRITHRLVTYSILGREIGNEFHKFSYEESPVTAKDLLDDKKGALKRLKKHSKAESYQGGMISTTIESIVKHYGGEDKNCPKDKIPESVMAEVARIIPSDQAINLVKQCGFQQSKGRVQEFFKTFKQRYPDLVDVLKSNIKIERGIKKK
jgi:hypothetical protein